MAAREFDRTYFWLLVPFAAASISLGRVWPVLPAVMQDEYVYSMQARFTPFAEQLYPNYLFSWLYSATSGCGAGFYQCGKSLNVFFYFATLTCIFLIARRLLSVTWSAWITAIAAFSPIHVYVSYFMPEAMYFAFITVTIYMALVAGSKHKLGWWVATGVMLGLSSLVKPHALFTLPALLLFALLVSLRSEGGGRGKAVFANLGTFGAFVAVKFGLGFAFAGLAGLSLFGPGYSASFNQFVNEIARRAVTTTADHVAQPIANIQVASVPLTSLASGVGTGPGFLDVLFPHSLAHLALLATIAAFPLLLSVNVVKDSIAKKQELSAASQFLILVGLLCVSFAAFISAFEGIVTSIGDDHSYRILTRYYEFMIPLLLIAAATFGKFVEPKIKWRAIQSAIVIATLIFAWVYLSGVNQSFADSILLSGYLSGPAVIPIVCVVGILVALIWIFSANNGSKIIVRVVTPLIILIAGFSSQSYLLTQVGTQPAYFDIAGQKAKALLTGVSGDRISIVGPVRYQNFTTKFWIDKPGIKDVSLPDGESIDVAALPDVDYAVLIGNAELTGAAENLEQGEGYAIIKIVR